ncbi:UDP-glucose 4-epimerase [Sphingobacterium spiritivorum]|uniref:UDP-glucose 4-epimerase n=1 Tax=Sphingobacterium spiritivorum TaxID=258 RepID=A0A380C539_SPHSI|nr:NAD-dependent epimerase/dehydratase family protein [Sphingobacterium spiritivorum]SUJ12976.1 UDP-glucose 4-epimerase [Sphingobacterium spiritivorum]
MEQYSIIVSGISGFVGQNLNTYFLNANVNVEALSLRTLDWPDRLSVVKARAIIHLAGKAHDTSNTSNAELYFKVNRDLTIRLFDQFLDTNIRDFFYFSSVKAVADTVEGELLEDVEASPQTPYGKSKLEAEEYLLSKNLPLGKRVFIIRPCMIHGPGNKGNLTLLYNIVEKGFPWPLAAFENKRSFLGIDNLCYLLKRIIEKDDVPSGIYNFADDTSLSTNLLVEIIAKSLKMKPRLWHISPSLINFGAKVGDTFKLALNSERLKKLTESYVVSNAKVKKAVEIELLPYTTEEGLRKTIKSFSHRD